MAKIQFKDNGGKFHTITIGGGDTPALTPSEYPFVTQVDTDINVFKPVRTTSAVLSFIADGYAQLVSLLPDDNTSVPVDIDNGEWSGFLSTQEYKCNYETGKFVVSLPCIDDIEALKSIPFVPTGDVVSFSDLLGTLYSHVNISGDDFPQKYKNYKVNDSCFQSEMGIDMTKYPGYNSLLESPADGFTCYDVLEAICQFLGLQCYEYMHMLHFIEFEKCQNDVRNISAKGKDHRISIVPGKKFIEIVEDIQEHADPLEEKLSFYDPVPDELWNIVQPIDNAHIHGAVINDTTNCSLMYDFEDQKGIKKMSNDLGLQIKILHNSASINSQMATVKSQRTYKGSMFPNGLALAAEFVSHKSTDLNTKYDYQPQQKIFLRIKFGNYYLAHERQEDYYEWINEPSNITARAYEHPAIDNEPASPSKSNLSGSTSLNGYPVYSPKKVLVIPPPPVDAVGKIEVTFYGLNRVVATDDSSLILDATIIKNISMVPFVGDDESLDISANDYTKNRFCEAISSNFKDVLSIENKLATRRHPMQTGMNIVFGNDGNYLTDHVEEAFLSRMSAWHSVKRIIRTVNVDTTDAEVGSVIESTNTEINDTRVVSIKRDYKQATEQLTIIK